jgi:hypothetical protein
MWEKQSRAYAGHADKHVFVTDVDVSWVLAARLVRWRVVIHNQNSLLCAVGGESLYAGGTVVGAASPTNLPVLHWFVKDVKAANTDGGALSRTNVSL